MTLKITPIDDTAAAGKWVKYYGVELCIARSDSERFRSKFLELTAPVQKELDDGNLPESEMEEITCRCMAHGILINWKKFVAEVDGVVSEVDYSEEKAYEVIKNDNDLRDFVFEYAGDIKNYLLKEEDRLKEK